MTPARRANLERLLNPRHIAFVGGADAAVAIGEARRIGYAGEIWPVNPRRARLAGLACHASVADLPAAPDAVFLAVPAARVVGATAQLSAMGAGGMVCYAAGFAEAGAAGRETEAALIGALGDMALIGPNCYGMINYLDRAALWPFAHGGDCPGFGAAIITQSGMFSSDITMSQRSLPLTHMISAGNQAALGIADFIDLLCEKPEVRAIGLHIEGLADIPAFERAALKALAHDTPVVALKTGSSAIGETLTLSHTGSLAGTGTLYEALFARTGVISVESPAQLLETLKFLCVAGAPRSARVAGFTCSGGGATMLADHAERIGLAFPAPDDRTRAALRGLLPPIATVSNPLDYTTPIWGQPARTGPVFATALAGTDAGAAVLVQDYPASGLDASRPAYLADARAFARAAASAGLPAAISATLPENLDAATRAEFVARGIAPMQGLQETLNAIRDAAGWRAAQERIRRAPPDPLVRPRPCTGAVMLDEAAGKARLAAAGLAVPRGRVVPGGGVANAAGDIGGPVAVKMLSARLPHKTEAGAVALNLATPEAAAAAAGAMREAVARHDPQAVTDRFLVEAMAPPPLAELIVGIRRDPQFGLSMTLGSGGILVELLADTRTLLLPAGAREIAAALGDLRAARLLAGYRGRPAADMEALAAALQRLADHANHHAGEVVEVEINPLFVHAHGATAVDVLMQVEGAA